MVATFCQSAECLKMRRVHAWFPNMATTSFTNFSSEAILLSFALLLLDLWLRYKKMTTSPQLAHSVTRILLWWMRGMLSFMILLSYLKEISRLRFLAFSVLETAGKRILATTMGTMCTGGWGRRMGSSCKQSTWSFTASHLLSSPQVSWRSQHSTLKLKNFSMISWETIGSFYKLSSKPLFQNDTKVCVRWRHWRSRSPRT